MRQSFILFGLCNRQLVADVARCFLSADFLYEPLDLAEADDLLE